MWFLLDGLPGAGSQKASLGLPTCRKFRMKTFSLMAFQLLLVLGLSVPCLTWRRLSTTAQKHIHKNRIKQVLELLIEYPIYMYIWLRLSNRWVSWIFLLSCFLYLITLICGWFCFSIWCHVDFPASITLLHWFRNWFSPKGRQLTHRLFVWPLLYLLMVRILVRSKWTWKKPGVSRRCLRLSKELWKMSFDVSTYPLILLAKNG